MNTKHILSAMFMFCSIFMYGQTKGKEYLILNYTKKKNEKYNNMNIHANVISQLSEPLKAIAAYYGAVYSTYCRADKIHHEVCELTMALGLGEQGSDMQKNLLKKWLGADTIIDVKDLVDKRNCFMNYSGASNFYELEYLKLTQIKDTVKIKYTVGHWFHGPAETIYGNDIAVIKGNKVVYIQAKEVKSK